MESIKEQVRVALEHLDNTQKLIGYAEETRTQKRNVRRGLAVERD